MMNISHFLARLLPLVFSQGKNIKKVWSWMNPYHERNIRQPKYMKIVHFAENYGNSIALYTLLFLIAVGVWLVSPIPSPNWAVNGKLVAWASVILIVVTTLHGILWFI